MYKEIEEMCGIIREWNHRSPLSSNVNSLLAGAYKDINPRLPHMLNRVIENKATEDLNKIQDALWLISEYEKRGMVFNFINYKTEENK